jgi:hypothetical protein
MAAKYPRRHVCRPRPTRSLAALGVVALLVLPTRASAQLHWAVGVDAGPMKRFVTDRPPSGADAGLGGIVQLRADVAVIPLVHVGTYIAHDVSPISAMPARQITEGGLTTRVTVPFGSHRLRAWIFAGFGYAGAYEPSYRTTQVAGQPPAVLDVEVGGAGGAFFEVPAGVGVAYKLTRPWEIIAELGTRIGFGFRGSLYDTSLGRGATSGSGAARSVAVAGDDSAALFLALGVALDF